MSEFKVGDEVLVYETYRGKVSKVESRCVMVTTQDHGVLYPIPSEIKLVNRPEDLYPGEVACVDEKTGQVTMTPAPGGTKHDQNKPDLSLLPLPALVSTTRALEYGAKKYGRHNFYNGFTSERLIGAALRHIFAWNEGEDNDPESGVSHLGHAAATLAMLLTIEKEGTLTDTRRKKK